MDSPIVEDSNLLAPGNIVPLILRPGGYILAYGSGQVSGDDVQEDEVGVDVQVKGFGIVFINQ